MLMAPQPISGARPGTQYFDHAFDGSPAHASIEAHLARNHGPITLVIPQAGKSGCMDLILRLEKAKPVTLELTSKRDAARCYLALIQYYSRFKHDILPVHFCIAFESIAYTIDHMAKSVRKELTLPDKAPELWPGKLNTYEDLDVFFGRVWAKYLPAGLDSANLKRLDRKLWVAIRNYPSTAKRPWPTQYLVPSNYTKMETALQKAEAGGLEVLSLREKVSVCRRMYRETSAQIEASIDRPLPKQMASRARHAKLG